MNKFSFTGNKGKHLTVTLRENASDYDSDDLMQLLEASVLAVPNSSEHRRMWNGHFFHSRDHEITVCFDRYGGRKDNLMRVERIGSGYGGSDFRIRIKRPQDSLSDLELMGAAGSIDESDAPKYVAKMPAHWRRKLFDELFTALKITTYSRTDSYEANTMLPLPEVRALATRIKSAADTKVDDAWIQIKSKKDWYLGDQGIELENYVSSRVKHMKYMLRRAKIIEDQQLISSLEACIGQLEALLVAKEPLSIYTTTAKAIINNHEG